MRHFVNIATLFSFVTLAVTGVMSYVLPFSLTTTRIHLVFGALSLSFITIHLWQRRHYFIKSIWAHSGPARALKIAILGAWLIFLAMSLQNSSPVEWMTRNSYEGKHQREIFRASKNIASYLNADTLSSHRLEHGNGIALNLNIIFSQVSKHHPAIAIWAESRTGSMIETLYLSPELAFSDTPTWHGKKVSRFDVLPIWRNRYTLINGLNREGKLDGSTGATDSHSFSLTQYLAPDAEEFLIYLEVNAPFDTDALWSDQTLGQPSVLYSAYLQATNKKKYVLLAPTGHGGAKDSLGEINYDLDEISSAENIIEVILAAVKIVSEPDK